VPQHFLNLRPLPQGQGSLRPVEAAALFAFRERFERLERLDSMLIETPNRACVANPAATQLPKSPKKQAFEGVVMYYGYRFYDPETGRWPSRDPIGEDGGINLYGFVNNDGVNAWDYLGFTGWQINDLWGNPLPGFDFDTDHSVSKPKPDKSETQCCDDKVILEGKNKLKEIYEKTHKQWEADGIPHRGKDDYSCFGLNSLILIEFAPIPKCWDCKLENGRTDPQGGWWIFGRKIYDHWVVVCQATKADGSKTDEISFDYWADRPAAENPNDWFRKRYKNPGEPDWDPPLFHRVCGSKKLVIR
jgi:RHS repeat-associated protein